MGVVRIDGKEDNGGERRMGEDVLTPPFGKCFRDRRCLMAPGLQDNGDERRMGEDVLTPPVGKCFRDRRCLMAPGLPNNGDESSIGEDVLTPPVGKCITDRRLSMTPRLPDNGDEYRVGEDVVSSRLGKCTRDQRRLMDPAGPTTEILSDSSRTPASWITTSVAMNCFLLAVIYHEWSRSQATERVSEDVVYPVKSEISPTIRMPRVGTINLCSGHGIYDTDYETGCGACRCHPCFTGPDCSLLENGCTIDLYQGDPTMFEKYWLLSGDSCATIILGWQRMSYYANSKQFFFIQTELDLEIRSLHEVVGNAVTEGRHIVIGVGSTQLFQAALYALASPSRITPTSVVSLAPYYSSYPTITDYLRSALYRWAGDAAKFKQISKEDPYIELVTTPNNPTGELRRPVVDGTGVVVHDLAYYWPHYIPISAPADNEVMLFTMSKSTGHAGTRIGWAIVKDLEVAQKMAKFIELNTIGVSKDAQIRATQILRSVTKSYRGVEGNLLIVPQMTMSEQVDSYMEKEALFHFGSSEMAYRWVRLRAALGSGVHFSLPEFKSSFCNFFKQIRTPSPAFAWLRCNQEEDCEKFLKVHGILTRGGVHFGAEPTFVRISMIDRRSSFEILISRLEALERREVMHY